MQPLRVSLLPNPHTAVPNAAAQIAGVTWTSDNPRIAGAIPIPGTNDVIIIIPSLAPANGVTYIRATAPNGFSRSIRVSVSTLPRTFDLVNYNLDSFARNGFFRASLPTGYNRRTHTNISGSEALRVLSNSRVFIFNGHGRRDGLITSRVSNIPGGSVSELTRQMVEALPEHALARAEMVVLAGCDTANIGMNGVNISSSIFNRGAGLVIGWRTSICIDMTCLWVETFMGSIAEGNTVNGAMRVADDIVREYQSRLNYLGDFMTEHRVVHGNANRRFP